MERVDDKSSVERIVTKFLLKTCRLYRQPSVRAVSAAAMCAACAFERRQDDEVEVPIPLITGSEAEFYIEPMLPHVGDFDIMYYMNNKLAILRGHPPPTQLPPEFSDYVDVFEIIDSDLPGYVYLNSRYLLNKCTDRECYRVIANEHREIYFALPKVENLERHGPAYTFHEGLLIKEKLLSMLPIDSVDAVAVDAMTNFPSNLPLDAVYCIRCLSWPPQAADWPTRHRTYGWPDSPTVDRVVSNGCDVVNVAHRQCRENESVGEYQCRLSFSRAEIVLLNSWIPEQQIVYHLLRVFMKSEQLTQSADNAGSDKLSNYHIKTLMLWACEVKPKSWWTGDVNLVRTCFLLLHTLADWLTERRCPHYFINKCNLVDNSFALEMIENRLRSIGREWLSSWFVNTYIRQSVQNCPETVLGLFNDISELTDMKLDDAVSAVVQWRMNTLKTDELDAYNYAEWFIAYAVFKCPLNVQRCICFIGELSKLDASLSDYFIAVAFLHIAHKVARGCRVEHFIETLSSVSDFLVSSNYRPNERTQSVLNDVVTLAHKYQQPAMSSTQCSVLRKLVELLQRSAVELITTFRQLKAREFGSVATIVTTEFEALYAYKHGDYQRCLQLSTQNMLLYLYAGRIRVVPTIPEFIQLLDDDIVSLIALTLIVNPNGRDLAVNVFITQLTLSLYLMTQCQLKLRHSVTSLALTLDCIEVAQKKHHIDLTLNHLVLKLIERKLMTYMTT